MVLIRKQYFRKHCEMVMREHAENHQIRGVWNSLARRSFRRNVSKVPDVQLKGPTLEEEPMSPEEPVVAAGEGIVAALVGGAGVGIGVGLDHRAFRDGALDGHPNNHPEGQTLLDRKDARQGVIADVHSFTSSPRSAVVSLQPLSPTSGNGNPGVRWDERSLQSQQARPDRNYMRKRASTTILSARSFQVFD